MYNETSQSPEPYFGWGGVWPLNIWGPSLLGAEFVRGRVCQGPSLLWAEMSRNPAYYSQKNFVNSSPDNKHFIREQKRQK